MNVKTSTVSSYQRGITFPSIERMLCILTWFDDDLESWAVQMDDILDLIRYEEDAQLCEKDKLAERLKEAKAKLDSLQYGQEVAE